METLNQLQLQLSNSLVEFRQVLMAYLPFLVNALLLLLIGWVVARLLKALILRFGHGIDQLLARLRSQTVPTAGPMERPVSPLFARIVFWLVMLLFVAAAGESLGLPGLGEWLSSFIQYLPQVIAAGVIIVIGLVLAGLADSLIYHAALEHSIGSARALGRTVQVLVIAFSVILGIGQLDLDISLLVNVVTISAAAIFGGLGLAFGLGARHQVSNIIAAQNLRSLYQIGQRIRINNIEGEIVEFTSKAVILRTEQGQALIPAKLFTERVCELILTEQSDE